MSKYWSKNKEKAGHTMAGTYESNSEDTTCTRNTIQPNSDNEADMKDEPDHPRAPVVVHHFVGYSAYPAYPVYPQPTVPLSYRGQYHMPPFPHMNHSPLFCMPGFAGVPCDYRESSHATTSQIPIQHGSAPEEDLALATPPTSNPLEAGDEPSQEKAQSTDGLGAKHDRAKKRPSDDSMLPPKKKYSSNNKQKRCNEDQSEGEMNELSKKTDKEVTSMPNRTMLATPPTNKLPEAANEPSKEKAQNTKNVATRNDYCTKKSPSDVPILPPKKKSSSENNCERHNEEQNECGMNELPSTTDKKATTHIPNQNQNLATKVPLTSEQCDQIDCKTIVNNKISDETKTNPFFAKWRTKEEGKKKQLAYRVKIETARHNITAEIEKIIAAAFKEEERSSNNDGNIHETVSLPLPTDKKDVTALNGNRSGSSLRKLEKKHAISLLARRLEAIIYQENIYVEHYANMENFKARVSLTLERYLSASWRRRVESYKKKKLCNKMKNGVNVGAIPLTNTAVVQTSTTTLDETEIGKEFCKPAYRGINGSCKGAFPLASRLVKNSNDASIYTKVIDVSKSAFIVKRETPSETSKSYSKQRREHLLTKIGKSKYGRIIRLVSEIEKIRCTSNVWYLAAGEGWSTSFSNGGDDLRVRDSMPAPLSEIFFGTRLMHAWKMVTAEKTTKLELERRVDDVEWEFFIEEAELNLKSFRTLEADLKRLRQKSE